MLLCCVLLSGYFIELTKSFVTFRGDKLPRTRGPGGHGAVEWGHLASMHYAMTNNYLHGYFEPN